MVLHYCQGTDLVLQGPVSGYEPFNYLLCGLHAVRQDLLDLLEAWNFVAHSRLLVLEQSPEQATGLIWGKERVQAVVGVVFVWIFKPVLLLMLSEEML